MSGGIKHIMGLGLVLLVSSMINLVGQDIENPLSPSLTLVTVDPSTGFSHLYWNPGGSPDVAGYVIYIYENEQGEPVDTIIDPYANHYLNTKTYANSYSVEYVVAAIDSSDNVSPLSNPLKTVFLTSRLDTCNHKIILEWNPYNNLPAAVSQYMIYVAPEGQPESHAGNTTSGTTTFLYEGFETGNTYCFRVEASLEGGDYSSSNLMCIETDIERPPLWINGDYALVDSENNIEVAFTYDSSSEIERFNLERADNPDGPFNVIAEINNDAGQIIEQAGTINNSPVYFRLSAINYCGSSVIYSNTVTAIPTYLAIEQNEVRLSWAAYHDFAGDLSEYRIYRIMNGDRTYLSSNLPGDTVYYNFLESFIYQNNDDAICYQVEALEIDNPYSVNSTSISQTGCIDTPVKIYVPNAFTPDGDMINETFYPVLTFTPKQYRLFIKTRSGVTVFSSPDYLEHWDGTHGGKALQPGVYLWFLELKTPGGKEIIRNGTVTILFN